MRFKIRLLLPSLLFLLYASSSFAQDLGQLRERALKLWDLRQKGNRLEALQLIEEKTRQTYLQVTEAPFSDFKLSGFEFTDDPNRMEVLVKVHTLVPKIGEIDKVVREPWVWQNGTWFMRAQPMPSLFGSDP